MPRHAKGPRLYLRRGRIDARTKRPLPDVYFIRDGQDQVSTGCGPDRMREAEEALSAYIAEKWQAPQPQTASRSDPDQILVADVLALYATEKAPTLASDPASTSGFIKHLLAWWGDKRLAEVKRSNCAAYVTHRTSQRTRNGDKFISDQTPRRELEVLSAAIGYWHGEDKLTTRPTVTLPPKPESPRDALTRSQAADLLRAAMGSRKDAQGRWTRLSRSARANRAHMRRFILIALYTGTRSGVITKLLWHESPTQAWVDLKANTIFRRGAREKDHKTKRRPVVKVPKRLQAHLRRWARMDEKLADCSAVIHHGGEPLKGKVITGFEGCVRDAGLPEEVTAHWLRHTAATFLMERNVDLWDAAGYLGMTTATLETHYGHHRPDYQSAAAAASGGRR